MSSPSFLLPAPVGKLLSLTPAYPGSVLFSLWLNGTFSDLLPADVLKALHGKRVAIAVTDAGVRVAFRWEGDRFRACLPSEGHDLAFSASAHDFFLLATRREDPDTLFFSRRLLVEGDTELGLLLKNTLDAIEWSVLDARLPPLLSAMGNRLARQGSVAKKIHSIVNRAGPAGT